MLLLLRLLLEADSLLAPLALLSRTQALRAARQTPSGAPRMTTNIMMMMLMRRRYPLRQSLLCLVWCCQHGPQSFLRLLFCPLLGQLSMQSRAGCSRRCSLATLTMLTRSWQSCCLRQRMWATMARATEMARAIKMTVTAAARVMQVQHTVTEAMMLMTMLKLMMMMMATGMATAAAVMTGRGMAMLKVLAMLTMRS